MQKLDELYSGKAKSVYTTEDPERMVLLFRDDTSAFDGEKVEQLGRKGRAREIQRLVKLNRASTSKDKCYRASKHCSTTSLIEDF